MHETRADTARAVTFALLLHAALFVLLFFGMWWTANPESLSVAGSPMSAEIADASDLSAAVQRSLAEQPEPLPAPPEPVPEEVAPPPQPLPEPKPQDSPVPPQPVAQERVPEPSPINQDRVDRDALAEEARQREQEEKRRQEQIDLTEHKRQEEAQKKLQLARQQLDDKIKKIQKEREKAAREADQAEQKLKQIADARIRNPAEASAQADTSANASPPPGNNGVDEGLEAQYVLAIQRAVESKWTRPDNIPPGATCRVSIKQLPGGQVIDASVDPSCPYDDPGKRSVEAAVLKAQPLPYAGFESVFNRQLNFNFKPSN